MSHPHRRIVLLACGHWFRETRSGNDTHPVDGEERRCARHETKAPAVYMADVDLSQLGAGWPAGRPREEGR